jgi:sugar transferase (PEP-CTERM/EpsH1 system associated)
MTPMRILWLSAGLLLPLDKGGKLRTWHLMRQLARQHEITCLSFAPRSTPRDVLDGMKQVCAALETIPREEIAKGTLRFVSAAAARLLDPLPYAVATYRSRRYRAAVDRHLGSGRFDAVVCDFLVPAVNVRSQPRCPSILFTHNVEAEIWRRHHEHANGRLRKALLAAQWRRMLRFEGHTLRRFDTILAVSDADRDTFRRLYGTVGPIEVIPTGVDSDYFAPSGTPPDPFRLVFTGSMDWLPNEDAAVHFCEHILPRIRAAEPRVSVALVGRSPTATVHRLAELVPGVEVTGRVDDVRPHLAKAALVVVPLRIGGGTRLKIYEAMAMGKAVVSTSVGAEGLPVVAGRDVAIADAPEEFAAQVLRLLRDPVARGAMETAARGFVSTHYDWRAVAGALDHAIRATVARQDHVVPPDSGRRGNTRRSAAALFPRGYL